MEEPLSITNINDFLFCPRSLYYGNIFRRSLGKEGFQEEAQKIGTSTHRTIDEGTYSTRKEVLTGTFVYCEKYNLIGRIDVYDGRAKSLMERKYSISAVYEGFRMQLYVQFFALQEIGLEVNRLFLHSVKDNRSYEIPLPGREEAARLEEILGQMHSFDLNAPFQRDGRKCSGCIYRGLCDVYQAPMEIEV